MNNAIITLGAEETQQLVLRYATQYQLPSFLGIDIVCANCCLYPDLAPDLSNKGRRTPNQCVEQWVMKFKHGYDERISTRRSKIPGTIPDQAVEIIVNAGLSYLTPEQANLVIYGHRLAMSAENILGLLLEEFLFNSLQPCGWVMAWGETIKSVDFCNAYGGLLQIKNRSNSENSSSSKIREGKPIEKWFRVNATNGRYEWDKLVNFIGIPDLYLQLSEPMFQQYIRNVLANNPAALAIEENNPWLQFRTNSFGQQ